MKIILNHCKKFEVQNYESEDKSIFDNCIVAQISFETDDKIDDIGKVGVEIEKMSKDVGKNKIILFPFAHLSNNLLEKNKANELFLKLKEFLMENFDVKLLSFGTDKEFLIETFGHPGSIRFRNF
ncbi:MAG: threonyl-tRNA synthetase editing domain-containing protein [Candidatus Paceibacterota bacterium]|jgi:threonyl-tRNA synthetase